MAYSSGSGFFYDTSEVYANKFSYTSSFRPFLADTSIPGTKVNETAKNANVISGIYMDNIFITTGQSGLVGIDYEKGAVYFNSGITYSNTPAHNRLSGNFVIPEFTISLTSEPEENLLFETKYSLKPKTTQTITGLGPNTVTYPVIFVKPNGSRAKEFALGGTEDITNEIRLLILADSQFLADGAASLIRDKVRSIVPLLTGVNEMPFDAFGGYAASVYNYNTTFTGKFSTVNSAYLSDVRITKLMGTAMDNLRNINPDVFINIVDCDFSFYRNPRG